MSLALLNSSSIEFIPSKAEKPIRVTSWTPFGSHFDLADEVLKINKSCDTSELYLKSLEFKLKQYKLFANVTYYRYIDVLLQGKDWRPIYALYHCIIYHSCIVKDKVERLRNYNDKRVQFIENVSSKKKQMIRNKSW